MPPIGTVVPLPSGNSNSYNGGKFNLQWTRSRRNNLPCVNLYPNSQYTRKVKNDPSYHVECTRLIMVNQGTTTVWIDGMAYAPGDFLKEDFEMGVVYRHRYDIRFEDTPIIPANTDLSEFPYVRQHGNALYIKETHFSDMEAAK